MDRHEVVDLCQEKATSVCTVPYTLIQDDDGDDDKNTDDLVNAVDKEDV